MNAEGARAHDAVRDARRDDFLGAIAAKKRASFATGHAGPGTGADANAAPGAVPVTSPVRPFAPALLRGGGIIAEIKRRSPSRGDLARDLDPAAFARLYEASGASAISVVTEPEHFAGSLGDLRAARAATSLAVLRKDFLVHPGEIDLSRAAGADAVLLIAAMLDQAELAAMLARAAATGMAALVEVHGEDEMERALTAGVTLIGINQRDLRTLAVDPGRGERLLARVPAGCIAVIESGLGDAVELARLRARGAAAFLIGESLVTAPDPAGRLRELVSAVKRPEGTEPARGGGPGSGRA